MRKKIISFVLAAIMIVALMPVSIFASYGYQSVSVELYTNEFYKDTDFSFDGKITVNRYDGTTRELDFFDIKHNVTFTGYKKNQTGLQTIKVQLSNTYDDVYTYYTINVIELKGGHDPWKDLQKKIDESKKDTPTIIQLDKDVIAKKDASALIIPEDKVITLDLNGHILNRNMLATDQTEYYLPSYPITGCAIINKGVLSIIDSAPTTYHLGTLLPNGGVIVGGNAVQGAGIFNENELTLENGTIYHCHAHGDYTQGVDEYGNGGAIMNTGTFIMTGGKIKDCMAACGGGGVYNDRYDYVSGFVMNGGVIENCSASTNGAGVYNEGTFTMNGGEIKNCDATENGGGVDNDGTFVMNAGKISNCVAMDKENITAHGTPNFKVANGGGVYNRGTFEMNGSATITSCEAQRGCGVWNSKDFTMAGGEITDCYVAEHKDIWEWGGGVFNESNNYTANFVMSDGAIKNCKASYGGGICSYTNANVTLLGTAQVKNNFAYDAGAGVYNNSGCTLTITDSASVTKNTSGGMGAGIENLGTLNLNKAAKVVENKQNEKDSNIYLDNGTKIHFGTESDAPTELMKVGISTSSPVITDNGSPEYISYLDADEVHSGILFVTDHFELKANSKVTIASLTNGVVISDKSEAKVGDTVTLTVTPYNGYQLKEGTLKVNNGSINLNKVNNAQYEFTIPSVEANVTAEFETLQPQTVYYYGGGGGTTTVTYVITVNNPSNGKLSVQDNGDTVTITVKPNVGNVLETLNVLDKNGKEIAVKDLGNDKYSFKMPSSNVDISATFMEDNAMLNFCVDVKADDFYYDSVKWAYENNICKGVEDLYFCPLRPVSRAEVITFLWRAAGSPVVDYQMNMADVDLNGYYAEAARWALAEKITNGTSNITFSPFDSCSRSQIVTLLSRYAGVKETEAESSFTDVKSTDYYAAAVKWAKDNGITSGTSEITFSPNVDCTRSEVVTFLYRHFAK